MGTTVTVKPTAELKLMAQQGDVTKGVDEKLMHLFDFIGGTTITVDDIEINGTGDGGRKLTFINNNLSPERNLYNIRIPEVWCSSYDLADNAENLYCKACSFTVKPGTQYHFAEPFLVSGTAGTADAVYRKELYSDRLTLGKDLVCPVCMKTNRFASIAPVV